MDTLGTTMEEILTVIALDVAVVGTAHGELDVMTQVTIFPVTNVELE